MDRLLRYWKASLRRYWWVLALWAAGTAYLYFGLKAHWLVVLAQLPLALIFLSTGAMVAAWRGFHKMLSFKHLAGSNIDLHYALEIASRDNLEHHLELWEQAFRELADQFQLIPTGRITVYLFRTAREMQEALGQGAGAFASPGLNNISAGFDAMESGERSLEVMRHELAHLFAARWGARRRAPPLNEEGLATWIQRSHQGRPIDFHALVCLRGGRCAPLAWLLDRTGFDDDRYYSYAVSGSFVGFLVRRYGWETYRQFFTQANRKDFDGAFAATFGSSLITAEREWRHELIQRADEFEPDLTWHVRRFRARAALDSWSLFQYLEEIDALARAGEANSDDLYQAAWCHTILGGFPEAIASLHQALEQEGRRAEGYEARLWLHIGALHDLLGERDQALDAYHQCLKQADDEEIGAHARARRRSTTPCTEEDWQEQASRG